MAFNAFRIGSQVRRRVDGVVQTVYDVVETSRVIRVNWLRNYKMLKEDHVIPDDLSEAPIVSVARTPKNNSD